MQMPDAADEQLAAAVLDQAPGSHWSQQAQEALAELPRLFPVTVRRRSVIQDPTETQAGDCLMRHVQYAGIEQVWLPPQAKCCVAAVVNCSCIGL